jgi:hypothetical protein
MRLIYTMRIFLMYPTIFAELAPMSFKCIF